MLAFNLWAFGNPLKLAYGDAVAFPGASGHDVLGLNSDGFFGITAPRFDSAVRPAARRARAAGAHPDRRHGRGRRLHDAPARAPRRGEHDPAVAAVYFIYNSGYWLPYGGGTPGPRFLIPALPFVAIGLAFAYRRLPALTLGLAIPSALFMLVGDADLSAARQAGHRHLGRLARGGQAGAHRPHRLRRHQRLACGRALVRAPSSPRSFSRCAPHPSTRSPDYRFAVPAVVAWACVSALGPARRRRDQPAQPRQHLRPLAGGVGRCCSPS